MNILGEALRFLFVNMDSNKKIVISVRALIQNNSCESSEDGDKIYEKVCETLYDGGGIILDFTGITKFSHQFIDSSFGRLQGRYSKECLTDINRLQVLNIESENVRSLVGNILGYKEGFISHAGDSSGLWDLFER